MNYIQKKSDDLIEKVYDQGEMDLIDDFAYPLTIGINFEILGIPTSDWHPKFRQWTGDLSLLADLDVSPLSNERGLLAIAGLADYFEARISEFRTASTPQDSLLGILVEGSANGDLNESELLATCILMFAVGHSSTTNLIGNAVFTLLRNQDQLNLLRRESAHIKLAIDEVLRYESPVQSVARTALREVNWLGTTIYPGTIVHCVIGSANRDPARFQNPENFDISRSPNPYLSFGQGIHTCLGSHLAKIVAEIALKTMLQKLPGMYLAENQFEWDDSFLGRGLKSLKVKF